MLAMNMHNIISRMMKLLTCFIVFAVSVEILYAQQYSAYPNYLRRSEWFSNCDLRLQYYGHSDLDNSGSAYTGRNDLVTSDDCPSGKRWETFRMVYKWNTSIIPSNATIKSAVLEIWYTSAANGQGITDVTFSVVPLAPDKWDAADDVRWSQIGAGTPYSTHTVGLSSAEQHLTINYDAGSRFCQDIKANLPSQVFILAMKTSDDLVWDLQSGTYRYVRARQGLSATQGVKLTINYSFPISVTIRNGLPVPGNGGTVTVDGVSKDSPFPTTWTSGESHTILSTTQTIGGNTYTPLNTWTNVTRSEQINQNPATVAPIENTTYEANFTQTSASVTVDQKLSTGTSVRTIGRWQSGPGFINSTAPVTFTFNVPSTEVLRGAQDILSGEKYSKWTRGGADEPDVVNHHVFSVDASIPDRLTSQFNSTVNATIQSQFQGGSPGGSLEFKDPWLIDYPDPNYSNNLRNQGMSAPFISVAYAANNLGTSTSYKGVLLNQDYNIPGNSYYTIRAPLFQTINGNFGAFQGWSWTNATLQNGSAPETGVVFTISGATVTANYSSTISQNLTIPAGTYYIAGNLTVASGATLTINSGATLIFTGYYKLRIEGILNASYATFQGSGYEGSWLGIEFYNASSSSSLSYCTIKDASYGLNLIGTLISPYHSTIRDNTYMVNCSNYSDPSFTSTVFGLGSWGVYGDETSAPYLGTGGFPGYNSFRTYGYYDVYSTYPGTIYAGGNYWWDGCPPGAVTPNVDYSGCLSFDPNPKRSPISGDNSPVVLLKAGANSPTTSTAINSQSIQEPGTEELDAAYRLFLQGKVQEALEAFEAVVNNYPENFSGCRALVFVERCLEKLGRSSEILATLNSVSAEHNGKAMGAFAEARRVYQYLKRGAYQDAITQAATTATSSNDTSLVKFALYDLGSVYWYALAEKKRGEEYYRQLIVRFPHDPLSASALVTLGEAASPSVPRQQKLASTEDDKYQIALQNYPNPFNPTTRINYSIPQDGFVSVKVFDILGREVAALVNEFKKAGIYQTTFDASSLPSGVYITKLKVADKSLIQKMQVLK